MKAKRGLLIVALFTVLVGVGLGGLSIVKYASGNKEFVADGFILEPSAEVNVTGEVNQQYYFNQGDTYREKYGTNILFEDAQGNDVNIPNNQFIHYMDGSLGAFTKGVIMDISEMDKEDANYGYYNLTKNTILIHNGSDYDITSRGETMKLSEFVWKISDTDYLYVSPEITLKLNESTSITLPDYAQIKYVDNGIVRIVHQQGTYQTISADTLLVSQSGAELNLVGHNFYVNGEAAFSLDQMSMNDDSYMSLDENADSPEIKIPTFQVINGQNGAPGATGATGEDGEDGEDGGDGDDGDMGNAGEMGGDGEGGSAGAAGSSGENGGRGNAGDDGNVGNNGNTGYDGASGTNGKDASNAATETGVIGITQNIRPTVVLDSASFQVTPGSVQMQLSMLDESQAVVAGETKVVIYERSTMKQVVSVDAWGSSLESGSSCLINASSLTPDTEYILIVSGQYISSGEDVEGKEANFFTKIFRTDGLGIKLEPQKIEETAVTLKTVGSGEGTVTYNVELYYYDESGNKVSVGTHSNISGVKNDILFDGSSTPIGCLTIQSNKQYYATLANVVVNGILVSSEGTEIPIMTLKAKPVAEGTQDAIETIVPAATPNEKDKSITVEIPRLVDPDKGIKSYRYQLFRESDYAIAIANNTVSTLAPAYEEITADPKNCTFYLKEDDIDVDKRFVARVVVVFDNNQTEMQYITACSPSTSLSQVEFPAVTFVPLADAPQGTLSYAADTIAGTLRITDTSGMMVIGTTNPLRFTLTSQYEDVIAWDVSTPEVNYTPGTYMIPFKQEGLRKNTIYSLNVTGSVDTNKNGVIEDGEKNTILGSTRITSIDYSHLTAVFNMIPSPGDAFNIRFSLAGYVNGETPTDAQKAASQYAAGNVEKVELALIQVVGGVEKLITTTSITDTLTVDAGEIDGNHKSIFQRDGFVDGQYVNKSSGNPNFPRDDGYTSSIPLNTDVTERLSIKPGSFGMMDATFMGGEYILRAISMTDYTGHANTIEFSKDGSDERNQITFTVAMRHIKSDPFDQIAVYEEYNGYNNVALSGLDENTVVGWDLQAGYSNGDVKKVVYHIFEVSGTGDLDVPKSETVLFPSGTVGLDPTEKHEYTIDGIPGMNIQEVASVIVTNGETGRVPISTIFFDPGSYPALASTSINDDGTTITITTKDENQTETVYSYAKAHPITRGKKYFVTYSVTTDHTYGIDCGDDNVDDIYPNCVYGSEPLPYYRSKVITTEKQAPVVQRFLAKTLNGTVTYKYKINDPDAAILGDSTNLSMKLYTSSKTTDFTPTTLNVNRAAYSNYADLNFTIPKGKYYYMDLTYSLTEGDEQHIISDIAAYSVGDYAPSSTDPAKLYAAGRLADVNTPAEDRENNSITDVYEKTILNMGGYRIRITLRGNDISKYAAYRVRFTSVTNPTKFVEYYPVYPEIPARDAKIMDDAAKEYSFGYLYLDTGALKDLKGEILAGNPADPCNTTVEVTGYRSTGEAGFDYLVGGDTPLLLRGITKSQGEYGEDYYLHWDEKNARFNSDNVMMNNTYRVLANSLIFTNTADSATNGLDKNAQGEPTNLHLRYFNVPTCLVSTPEDAYRDFDYPVVINETGLVAETVTGADMPTQYLQIEQAASQTIDFKRTGQNVTSILNIFPAVNMEASKSSSGASSLVMHFDLHGTGALDTTKIYAEIAEEQSDSSLRYVKVTTLVEDGITKLVVDPTNDTTKYVTDKDTYYSEGSYGANNIPVATAGGLFDTELHVQGLSRATKYYVRLFTYDTAGKAVYLYDKDYKRTGLQYSATTKSFVTIEVSDPNFIYNSYMDKSASFGFSMKGDEGTGMKVSYVLCDNAGNEIGSWRDLAPIGSGSRAYYSADPAANSKISWEMTPGGVLHMNSAFKIKVRVTSTSDNANLLEDGYVYKSFATPSALPRPSMFMNPSETVSGGKPAIKVSLSCTDTHYALCSETPDAFDASDVFHVSVFGYNSDGTIIPVALETRIVSKAAGDVTSGYILFENTVSNPDRYKSGEKYLVSIRAQVDTNNDKIADTNPIKVEKQIQLSGSASAQLGYDAEPVATHGAQNYSSGMTLIMSEPQNFSDVGYILVTLFKDGVEKTTKTFTMGGTDDGGQTLAFDSAGKMDIRWNWTFASGVTAAGDYTVQVQYQKNDASLTMLGNDSFTIRVK